ncbi:MAG TPA: phosphomannomutase/phosphoglucomutase [Blastocatellia bacterium]|nr:phosphomannomutase/phosphoglucomutase [Blastocatellia bacterium]
MNPHIFREYDIRGVVGSDLTGESVYELARAIGTFYRNNNAKRVSLGRDARESSPKFRDLMARGLNETGCDVIDVGMVPTPLLYFTLFTEGVDGGVMITGSHNPPNENGFKICLGKSTIFGPQILEIKQIAESGRFAEGRGSLEERDIITRYQDYVASNVKLGPRRLKVVVDAGNGMGGFVAAPLYRRMGCEVIELFCEPDSRFPNHHPDPTVVENMRYAIEAVKERRADLAIAFDGDADRIGVVDEQGRIIWGDQLMILFARAILKERPGATFIAEVKCSQTLFDEIRRAGGTAIMWKVGHSLIKAKMKETGAAMAGEMSGHMFFADRYFGYDDAIYAGARLLEILSHTEGALSSLLADLPQTFYTPEIRIACPDDKKFDVVRRLAEEFSKTNEVIAVDGARVVFEHGWGLVRASNTQPVLVLRFEADSEKSLEEIRRMVEAKAGEFVCADERPEDESGK